MIKNLGQATVEYIFILFVAISLGTAVVNKFSTFFKDQMGRVGHVLSTHLIIGSCPQNCFYGAYLNGHRSQ
jgi:hypothetical protein